MLLGSFLSALLNLSIFAGVPFLAYFAYNRWRQRRAFSIIAHEAGLRLGELRYIVYCLALALVFVFLVTILPLPLAPFARVGSPESEFVGLGLSGTAIAMALIYGVVQTGFTEELLFRGLIAGSLSRRLRLVWANILQALIFLAPHLLVLRVMPEMWPILPLIFGVALFVGWARIRSGSILGPWLAHAALNVTMCLSVAIRSVH